MDSYISFLTSIIMANRNMGFKVGSGAGSNSSSFNSKASSNSNTNNSGDRMTELAAENWKRRIKMDILAIAVALALQDGPFFCLRMTLIFRFRVISHMNIFFTCKNTLVILLQLYRLFILFLEW